MVRMDESDAAVVAQVLAGDRDAFRVVVERHSRGIFRLAYRMTGNEQDAEEVVQETFLRAYKRLNRFESRSSFGTWIYRIGVNCSLDLVRHRQKHEEHRAGASPESSDGPPLPPSDDPTPDRLVFSAEIQKKIAATLKGLTEKEHAAFVLRHFEGMGIEDIASVLGLKANAAKNNVFRAVQKLRRELQPLMNSNR